MNVPLDGSMYLPMDVAFNLNLHIRYNVAYSGDIV